MNAKEIKELIDLMNANDLLELEVVEEGTKIRLKKMYDGGTKIMPMPMPAAPAAAPAAGAAPASGTPAAPATKAGAHVIKSPMVGTFYRSASPDSAPYVDVGDPVKPESVVCILEAMKVFNEIRAEMEGRIVQILVENGEAVEYGQPLFAVEPA
ncbi:MAG: acetyl-CoA carboxylase biotin carboxyl carrier protein [Planctomycetes bacterium]|nr:acetyl-CoA carboxylase biotin carboxyl carrier protein [Planctomycetota bacterium]NUQ36039.1 acetyl-CoA carboxylase biotin carboxyl carrier protein [Planctomycetaceae bacterium]